MLKMKINNNSNSICDNCGRPYKCSKEMYDILLIKKNYTVCKECCEVMFKKLLKADCMYNEKLKSQLDLARVENSKRYNKFNEKIV